LRKFMKEFNRKNGNVLNFGGAKWIKLLDI
jgi:hypothetical protein